MASTITSTDLISGLDMKSSLTEKQAKEALNLELSKSVTAPEICNGEFAAYLLSFLAKAVQNDSLDEHRKSNGSYSMLLFYMAA